MKKSSLILSLSLLGVSILAAMPLRAESYWLVLVLGNGYQDGSLATIPMVNLNQCEEQGAIWASSKRAHKQAPDAMGFECIKGK